MIAIFVDFMADFPPLLRHFPDRSDLILAGREETQTETVAPIYLPALMEVPGGMLMRRICTWSHLLCHLAQTGRATSAPPPGGWAGEASAVVGPDRRLVHPTFRPASQQSARIPCQSSTQAVGLLLQRCRASGG